ncbi:GAF domain-containing protein [Geopsychrobacter electrodiphilus]|uniref:GAF domain-containing protein n=1 Tax=Geopsychrobacter electrodiphilus TaxID=225196 RepID=UPI0003828A1A|nr:GAF domain-containing protein [Geopsychrobacter electrodiphilus]
MVDKTKSYSSAAELRSKAETKLASQPAATAEIDEKRLLHELQVHQVELEMQNEELEMQNEELRLANYTLIDYELHLQNVIKMTPAGYFRLDPNDCFVDVNDAWLKMHLYDSRDEIIGEHFSLLQVDSTSELALKHLKDLHSGTPIPLGEFASRRKDGSVGHHIFSAHPVIHAGGIVGFEWFIIDISERVMTEAILQARIRMKDFALQHTLSEVLTKSLDEAEALTESTIGFFHFLAANQKMLEMQAWSSKTLATLRQVKGNSQHYAVDAAGVWADCVRQREPVVHNDYSSLPHRKGLPEGHAPVVRELVVPIFRGDAIVAIFGVGNKATGYTEQDVAAVSQLADLAWDIVVSKKAEEEKRLLEQQFQQAQKLESLGVLSGGIAHDFNNILAVIIGNCELAKLKPHKVGELLPNINKAAHRGADLCRQMLAYAGKSLLIMQQIKMAELIEDMLRMLKSTINKNVVITSVLAEGLPEIQGDASQIRQIVMNLIINGGEAIGDEYGEIRVELAAVTIVGEQLETDHLGKNILAGQYICLKVTDSGCGMNAETRQRLFEPFYTTKFSGRGLGMSAVLGIITAHKGALQVFSKPGEGTTFTVYLPVQRSEATDENPLPDVPMLPWQGIGTVLLVEDEPPLRKIARDLIMALGFTVIDTAIGTEALELYQKHAADITLVVTDIGMPIMDGYELFNKLKERAPDLSIIICSGFGEMVATSRIKGTAAGFLNKPYSFDELRDVLRSAVESSTSSPA